MINANLIFIQNFGSFSDELSQESGYATKRHVQVQHRGFKFQCRNCGVLLSRKNQEHKKCKRGFWTTTLNMETRSSGITSKFYRKHYHSKYRRSQAQNQCRLSQEDLDQDHFQDLLFEPRMAIFHSWHIGWPVRKRRERF